VQPQADAGLVRPSGRQPGRGVADDGAPQGDQLVAVDARRVGVFEVGGHEQVVDDLLDEVVQVVDQLGVVVEVA
jgi:hypothetical protein